MAIVLHGSAAIASEAGPAFRTDLGLVGGYPVPYAVAAVLVLVAGYLALFL